MTKAGFKALDRKGVTLTVDTRSRVNLKLEIGTVSDSIDATENVGALQVDSPEISTTIAQGQVWVAAANPSSGIGNGAFDPGKGSRITNAAALASPVSGGVSGWG